LLLYLFFFILDLGTFWRYVLQVGSLEPDPVYVLPIQALIQLSFFLLVLLLPLAVSLQIFYRRDQTSFSFLVCRKFQPPFLAGYGAVYMRPVVVRSPELSAAFSALNDFGVGNGMWLISLRHSASTELLSPPPGWKPTFSLSGPLIHIISVSYLRESTEIGIPYVIQAVVPFRFLVFVAMPRQPCTIGPVIWDRGGCSV